MFTGVVESVGTIEHVEDRGATRRIRIAVGGWAGDLAEGDSVAVDGACLTVIESSKEGFAVDVIETTLRRTVAISYQAGVRVNLERALRMGERIDGHLVQGHVDGIGHLMRSVKNGESWTMDFRLPREVADQTVERGSVTLNGVSLTVSSMPESDVCRIGVIPFTHANTNLGDLAEGAPVNVEGDLIGKYVRRMLAERGAEAVRP